MRIAAEQMGINLVGSSYNSKVEDASTEATSIEAVLPKDIENSEHKILGEGKDAFFALKKPLTETHHEESDFFPEDEKGNKTLESTEISFLMGAFNEELKKLEEFLFVFEQIKMGNIVFTDPRPLESWMEILNKKGKDCKKCIYKSNKGYSILSYGNWIVKDKEKYPIENVGISNSNPMYLTKNFTQEEREKIIELNKAA